jgi:hypothetical protein
MMGTPSGGENLPKASVSDSLHVISLVGANRWRMQRPKKENLMTNTEAQTTGDGANRVIDSLQDAEKSGLEAVRRFLDTVNGVFPDTSADGGPRQKIIESAFKMTEQLVGASNQLAQKIVKVSQSALGESLKVDRTSKK